MAQSIGDEIGPYRILAAIGAGGMGDVYRATDRRLNRDVAIKIARDRFSSRFETEARAVAALNHPNICTLYDVGPNYIVCVPRSDDQFLRLLLFRASHCGSVNRGVSSIGLCHS